MSHQILFHRLSAHYATNANHIFKKINHYLR
nr:MAG TPA: hypothetical protein [Caudoviricetes sp.]